jgi:Uma2 family endonuclease
MSGGSKSVAPHSHKRVARFVVASLQASDRKEYEFMPAVTASAYLEAIAHLPAGTVLSADDVSWEEYEQLLEDLGPSYAARIFYYQGRMEIMAPASAHERPVKVIFTLLGVLRDELDIDIESIGSTTLKKQMAETGAEPDDSFYVQNAASIIGKLDISLEHDPPPDIAVESDRTSASLNKFAIYAALEVPEIWRIAKRRVTIWLLTGESYQESPVSRAFPFLPVEQLNVFLAKGLAEGERKAARALRDWVRKERG